MKLIINKKQNKIALTAVLALFLLIPLFLYNKSSEKNTSAQKILFLGNSITSHGPAKEINWHGSWGMAASSMDMDYVHIVVSDIKPKDYMVMGIGRFETDFNTIDFNLFSDAKKYKPDILIYQAGENTPVDIAIKNDYKGHVKKLIDYIGAKKVIIISEFWPEPNKYQMMNSLAKESGYGFADISKVMFQTDATAVKKYGNTPVGIHPSDKGMQLIADEVLKRIKE